MVIFLYSQHPQASAPEMNAFDLNQPTTTINLNLPLPSIQPLPMPVIPIPEIIGTVNDIVNRVPKKGEIITVCNLNYNHAMLWGDNPITVTIPYINGIVIFCVENIQKSFCFVKLPSIEKYIFYNYREGKPISKVLDQQKAYRVVVDMTRKAGREPSETLLKIGGMVVDVPPRRSHITPPLVPLLPVRTHATKTIVKKVYTIIN